MTTYIRHFKTVGSVISSSNQFGAQMHHAAQAFFPHYQRGVFVGTGSGVIAKYFINAPIPFSFIEQHPNFAQLFKTRFGHAPYLLEKNFFDLPFDETREGLNNCLIVSCMPITGRFYSPQLVPHFQQALDNGSTIIQMAYLPNAYGIHAFRTLKRHNYSVQRYSTTLFNIPPASVFVITRNTGTHHD